MESLLFINNDKESNDPFIAYMYNIISSDGQNHYFDIWAIRKVKLIEEFFKQHPNKRTIYLPFNSATIQILKQLVDECPLEKINNGIEIFEMHQKFGFDKIKIMLLVAQTTQFQNICADLGFELDQNQAKSADDCWNQLVNYKN